MHLAAVGAADAVLTTPGAVAAAAITATAKPAFMAALSGRVRIFRAWERIEVLIGNSL